MKAAFNSRNAVDGKGEEDDFLPPRFTHAWENPNDGIFVMLLSDFMKYFN